MLTNARSLFKKLDDLKVRFTQFKPDIVIVSETWLTNEHYNPLMCINNYNMFQANRIGKQGGGVAIWGKVHFQLVQLFSPTKCNHIDVIWLVSNNYKLIVCGLYIPPNLSVEINNDIKNYIVNYFDHLLIKFSGYVPIIVGDFNKLETNTFIQHICVKNIVNVPTRHSSALDLILIGNGIADNYSSVKSLPPLQSSTSLSDHNVILIKGSLSLKPSLVEIEVLDLRASNVHALPELSMEKTIRAAVSEAYLTTLARSS